MKTWMDSRVYGARDRLKTTAHMLGLSPDQFLQAYHAENPQDRPLWKFKEITDFEAHLVTAGYGGKRLVDTGMLPINPSDPMMAQLRVDRLVAGYPFYDDASFIAPSRDLIEALAGAESPVEPKSLIAERVESGAAYYIDVPHGSMKVGEAQVRAIFVQETNHRDFVSPDINAVLTMPRSNAIRGVLRWLHYEGLSEVARGFTTVMLDHQLLRDQIEHFIALLLIYRDVAGSAQRGRLPEMPDGARRNPRRSAQVAKKFSLFSVETLAPPADRFGRKQGAGEGWNLGYRSEVRGHFKMQPHGPKQSLRKLIWVDSFERGPRDAPRRRKLERLDVDQAHG